jgi:hypothetical protein
LEFWKDIRDFEGRYQASSIGRIRSLITNKIMSQYIKNNDYPRVTLCFRYDNRTYQNVILVHLLIADTFLGIVPEGLEVNHINGIKTDNRIENLEYVTRQMNIQHSFRTGLNVIRIPYPGTGEDHANSNLSNIQRKDFFEKWISGLYSQAELSEQFNISIRCIKSMISRLKEGYNQGLSKEDADFLREALKNRKNQKLLDMQDYILEQSKTRTYVNIAEEMNLDTSYVAKLAKRAKQRV